MPLYSSSWADLLTVAKSLFHSQLRSEQPLFTDGPSPIRSLNLRNLRPQGSLRYLVLTGVPDDSQRQIQSRQASPATPIAEHLRASIHRIRPRRCSGHQSQRCRNVIVCHRESAVGISSSDRISSSPLLRTGSSLWDCSPSRCVSIRNRVSSGIRPTPRWWAKCRHNYGPSTLSPVNSRLTPSPLRSLLQNPHSTGAADKAVNLVGCKSPHHQLPGRVVSISDACGGNEACSARM